MRLKDLPRAIEEVDFNCADDGHCQGADNSNNNADTGNDHEQEQADTVSQEGDHVALPQEGPFFRQIKIGLDHKGVVSGHFIILTDKLNKRSSNRDQQHEAGSVFRSIDRQKADGAGNQHAVACGTILLVHGIHSQQNQAIAKRAGDIQNSAGNIEVRQKLRKYVADHKACDRNGDAQKEQIPEQFRQDLSPTVIVFVFIRHGRYPPRIF